MLLPCCTPATLITRTPPPPLQAVVGQLQLPYQGQVLDFESPFRRATMHDLVKDACGVDFEQFGSGDLEVRLLCCWGGEGRGRVALLIA